MKNDDGLHLAALLKAELAMTADDDRLTGSVTYGVQKGGSTHLSLVELRHLYL